MNQQTVTRYSPVEFWDMACLQNRATASQIMPPNGWSRCLESERRLWMEFGRRGGLEKVCCPAAKAGPNPPYVVMPPDGVRFQNIDGVLLSSLTASTETDILNFRAPTGYDGVIVGHLQLVSPGTGFVEASGEVTWRIWINQRPLKDYAQMTTTLGGLGSPNPLYRGGVHIKSHQVIRYTVTVTPAGLAHIDPTDRIIAGLIGWYYPY